MGYDLLGKAASESSESRIICKLIGWDERVDAHLITLLRVKYTMMINSELLKYVV